ncbi:PQQ-binding-like beta-propeller repeat protein [Massilia sp. SR12]
MTFKPQYAALPACLLLAACGGGSSTDNSKPVLLAAQASISQELSAGDEVEISFETTITRENAADPVYIKVSEAAGRFVAVETSAATGSNHKIKLATRGDVAAGSHSGTIEIRACKDAACAQPYPGALANLPYTLKVAAVGDWAMHQRDAAHSGYVPITLNPARFAKAWEWQYQSKDPIGGINAVATMAGKVFVTGDVYFGSGNIYALFEADGKLAWQRSLGAVPAMGPPAVSNGKVFAPVTGHEQTFVWTVNAADGAVMFKSPFGGQWPHVLAPTVIGDQMMVGAGYQGGITYSFNTVTGASNWSHSAGGAWDMFAPAADDVNVYHHNGHALYVINRATGVTEAKIDDLLGNGSGDGYFGGPLLGSKKNVISFAGTAFSGRAASNVEHYGQRVLSGFDIADRKYLWSTNAAYLTAPALANGVLYAGRNSPASLDAMDEANGKVLWSWTPPGAGETFHRNIIVTRNLLFFSTSQKVYAMDLASKKVVWSHNEPGMLALSADRTLYIAVGATASNGKLVAIRLK